MLKSNFEVHNYETVELNIGKKTSIKLMMIF